jgi:hypothetical protein
MAEQALHSLALMLDSIPSNQWPELSCSQANQLALGNSSDLRLEAQREIVFQDNGQIRSFDGNHKLVFNRGGNLLEMHEQGDIRFLTGGPPPAEKLRILANGNVGIGASAPTQKLEVVGTVKATAFQGNGAALTGVSATDVTKVAKAGDTMIGALSITAAGTGLSITNNAAVGGTVTVGSKVGIGTTNPAFQLSLGSSIARTKLALYETGASNSYGLGVTSGTFRLHLNGNQARYAFFDSDEENANEIVTIKGIGNVGVGIVNPAYKLDVAGSAHATSFPTSSDERFKMEVRPLAQVLEKLEKIHGISFEWNELYASLGRSTGHREIGVIAQEVEAVFPELVTTWGHESYKAIDYGRLTAVLVEAIKQLKTEIEALKRRAVRPQFLARI